MTEESRPVAESDVPPDHPFHPSGLNFCDHVVLVLENHTVYCGLRRNQHPVKRITIPEPKDGP